MEFILEVPVVNSVLPISLHDSALVEQNLNVVGDDIPPPKPKYHADVILSDLSADVVGDDIPPPKPK